MNIAKRFEGCIIGGAIGDAYGSGFENQISLPDEDTLYLFEKPKVNIPKWRITDDTQLTIATCEVLIENDSFEAKIFAKKYLDYYKKRKLIGLGSSTLKALQELEAGGHWSQVGRRGEYAAGNGAAMRIAPLAFIENIKKELIRDVSIITHNNDEAYVGALSIYIAINSILDNTWTGKENLIEIIIDKIPDTRVRDRFIQVNKLVGNINAIGKLGNNGYVVNSIPLAIAAANDILNVGIEKMYNQLIDIGGDTDTNCSIAGQIAGALIGPDNIPASLQNELKKLSDFQWINDTIQIIQKKYKWI